MYAPFVTGPELCKAAAKRHQQNTKWQNRSKPLLEILSEDHGSECSYSPFSAHSPTILGHTLSGPTQLPLPLLSFNTSGFTASSTTLRPTNTRLHLYILSHATFSVSPRKLNETSTSLGFAPRTSLNTAHVRTL